MRAEAGSKVVYAVPDVCLSRTSPSPLIDVARNADGTVRATLASGVPQDAAMFLQAALGRLSAVDKVRTVGC